MGSRVEAMDQEDEQEDYAEEDPNFQRHSSKTGSTTQRLDPRIRRERMVFILRDLQGMSTGEIGRILRLSQITVRRHCMGARKRLRERLFDRSLLVLTDRDRRIKLVNTGA